MQLKFNTKILLSVFLFCISGCTGSKIPAPQKATVFYSGMVELGNFQQAVTIRGQNADNPVLIHLHGGPGYPLYPFINDLQPLEEYFTLVYWEQRGTAKSFSKNLPESSMTTDTLLRDLHELIVWTQQKLGVSKVFIWGHSWGTNLGLLYAAKYPEDVLAYVGTGQSVNLMQNERLCYQFACQQAQVHENAEALRELERIDTTNYSLNNALLVRKWIYTYGGVVHQNDKERRYVSRELFAKVMQTPEYTLKNKINLIRNRNFSGETLWDDMMQINLFHQVPKVEVPVYFLLGKHDHLVSSILAAEYFNVLEAPAGKQLIWFNISAHRPHTEESEKFLEWMLKIRYAHSELH
ncbi:MAG: alpha/beta hydrolase [Bacteroidetes bacterium HGW-Bacteroidetes-4]|nr:MAG: alpha/beta hydrolase [Bacteroidetes bacterium HGW-Bacteroidetes-4]